MIVTLLVSLALCIPAVHASSSGQVLSALPFAISHYDLNSQKTRIETTFKSKKVLSHIDLALYFTILKLSAEEDDVSADCSYGTFTTLFKALQSLQNNEPWFLPSTPAPIEDKLLKNVLWGYQQKFCQGQQSNPASHCKEKVISCVLCAYFEEKATGPKQQLRDLCCFLLAKN